MIEKRSISGFTHRTTPGGSWRGAFVILIGLSVAVARSAAAAPRVAVFESPTAVEWLRSAGVECTAIAAAELNNGLLPDIQLLVLPLDRVHSDVPLHALTTFTARGGKVLAVYWGTIARPEQQSDYPVYTVGSALGGAPSTRTRAPWRCAIATISRAGVIVPRAFET